MKKRIFFFMACLMTAGIDGGAQERWRTDGDGAIAWIADGRIPHFDHIEMSGFRVSTVVRYGVDATGAFQLNRGMVWPLLRTIPNDTHASLMRRIGWNATEQVLVGGRPLAGERVRAIRLDGVMTVESEFAASGYSLTLVRRLFPSVSQPAFCEKYTLRNTGGKSVSVEIPAAESVIETDKSRGVAGSYRIVVSMPGGASVALAPSEEVSFAVFIAAYKQGEAAPALDVDAELAARRALVAEWQESLVLQTPDTVINTLFALAKIRGAESIFDTQGGLLHGPGGEAFYAAIWANDQAEYINPFFPFLGYEAGNRSALTSFRHFARFMNADYRRLPSSIIAEGLDIWDGAGDRGDAAMIACGAARYALARGSVEEARELWPLIAWCLEYCHRQLNAEGVVASDSDELENRFPSGDANLCTSSLYYDALLSAALLGRETGVKAGQLADYRRQAEQLRAAIEAYFGATVEGFDTYQYYKGNDILRSWICIPLTVGIDERKEATLEALFSPRLRVDGGLLTQAGSRTFWDRSTLYALRGVYACGEANRATAWLHDYSARRLLGDHVPYPVEAYPEGAQRHLSAESGLYGRVVTEGLFGIRPTGLKSFTVTPRLPDAWERMALRQIKAFGTAFDIEVRREGRKIRLTVRTENRVLLDKSIPAGATASVTVPVAVAVNSR
ncbi:MAG: hypothetical protein LBS12_04405 [Prevotellaceae bacterium]|jgi:hypothetical protein|nr:hypothetical protein [Prevotellaceae bacterium]